LKLESDKYYETKLFSKIDMYFKTDGLTIKMITFCLGTTNMIIINYIYLLKYFSKKNKIY